MRDYNIHCLLYDLTRGHFKSKWLCKHDKHNYQLHAITELIPEVEEIFDPRLKYKICRVVRYNRIWKSYYRCYCCGAEINLESEEE